MNVNKILCIRKQDTEKYNIFVIACNDMQFFIY